jgi:hypothetical protein
MAERRDDGGGATLLAFVAGAAIGAGMTWLLTARRETVREQVDKGLAWLDEAKVRLAEALEAGREAARRESERLARDWAQVPKEGAPARAPEADPVGPNG